MIVLKLLLAGVPLYFLFHPQATAGMAPLAAAAGGLLLWWMEPEEPPRLAAWGAALAAAAVAVWKGAPYAWAAAAATAAIFYVLEIAARRAGKEVPPRTASLAAMAAAALLAWGVHGAAVASSRISGGPPRRILAIGDSLTAGVPGDGVDRRWPDILAERLGAEAVNWSYPGDTTTEAWERWRADFAARRFKVANPAWRPDMAIVLLGGNDIRRGAGRAALERDLRLWAEELSKLGVRALFLEVPGALLNDPYAGAWRSVAEDFGFSAVPNDVIKGIWTSPNATLPDRIHFNQEGNERLAAELEKLLRN